MNSNCHIDCREHRKHFIHDPGQPMRNKHLASVGFKARSVLTNLLLVNLGSCMCHMMNRKCVNFLFYNPREMFSDYLKIIGRTLATSLVEHLQHYWSIVGQQILIYKNKERLKYRFGNTEGCIRTLQKRFGLRFK